MISATLPVGFFIVLITPVFGPGAGETVPVILMGCAPEYEGWSVWSVIVYVVAAWTGATPNDKRNRKEQVPADMARAVFKGARLRFNSLEAQGLLPRGFKISRWKNGRT